MLQQACFNFSPLSKVRLSYLKCPTSNSVVHYTCILSVIPTLNALLRIGRYSTPNALLCIGASYSKYSTSTYNRVSYSKCPAPYKCVLIRIDFIWSPASYKTLLWSVQQDVIDKPRIIYKLYKDYSRRLSTSNYDSYGFKTCEKTHYPTSILVSTTSSQHGLKLHKLTSCTTSCITSI